MIKFLSWIFDCSSICSVWKFTGDISMSTENEVTNIQKNWWFFLQSWNLFLNSFIKLESTATYFFFFAVHRTMFSLRIKMHDIICHKLIQHCTVPSPFPRFSSDSAITHWCCLLLSNGCALRARLLSCHV